MAAYASVARTARLMRFDPGWLRFHATDDESGTPEAKPKPYLWRSDLRSPVFGMMNDNAALQRGCSPFAIGLTQRRGVPTEPVR